MYYPEAQLPFPNNCFRKFAACDQCWKGFMEKPQHCHSCISKKLNWSCHYSWYIIEATLKVFSLYHIKPSLNKMANIKGIWLVCSSNPNFQICNWKGLYREIIVYVGRALTFSYCCTILNTHNAPIHPTFPFLLHTAYIGEATSFGSNFPVVPFPSTWT